MAYTPPSCSSIDFQFSGTYIIPDCDSLNFDIGGTAPHEIVNDPIEIVLDFQAHEVFDGDMIVMDDMSVGTYFDDHVLDPLVEINMDDMSVTPEFGDHAIEILPDVVNDPIVIDLEFGMSVVRTTEDHHLPSKIDRGLRAYSWKNGTPSDDSLRMSWDEGTNIYQHNRFSVKESAKPDHQVHASWKTQLHLDWTYGNSWNEFELRDHSASVSWTGIMNYQDLTYSKSWDENFYRVDESFHTSWNVPGEHDTKKCVSWDKTDTHDFSFHTSWNVPGEHDVKKCNSWGPYSYYTLCTGDEYSPPMACANIEFNFPNKHPLVSDVCSGITFHMNTYSTNPDPRCPWDHVHSGLRDRYPGIELPDIVFPAQKEVYYMLNSILVKEIITNTPIQVLHVDATIDRDSWLWQFNVTVASRDCLDVIKPANGVYAHILIEMNGYKWYCTVESWRESRTFGKDTWTISGRSPSMMFASPIAKKWTNTELTALQGQTLFEGITRDGKYIPDDWPGQLQLWTDNWDAYLNTATGFAPYSSWYIPSGTLSYSDQSPIETLQSIASAIGAYIQTEPDANVLSVKPKYAWQPWDWNSANTEINWRPIIESQCKEIARGSKTKSLYHVVHVMGEAIGGNNSGTGADPSNTAVFTEVCREGFCDELEKKFAPMTTHPLMTSSKAGLEAGRMILGNTGDWVEHTLRLNVLCYDSLSSGLFTPGDMLTMLERGTPWYGQVTGTTITAIMTNNAFNVTQTINVEEYVGD